METETNQAHYPVCKNDQAKYVDEWWKVVAWDDVAARFDKTKK